MEEVLEDIKKIMHLSETPLSWDWGSGLTFEHFDFFEKKSNYRLSLLTFDSQK